jgi:hypothetical protein
MAAITQTHPDVLINPSTFLTQKVSAGGTTLTVKNNASLNQYDFVVVGKLGIENTEIREITAAVTPGTSLTVDTLIFDHGADTPVTFIKVNQVKVYRSTDAGVTYPLLATLSITPDEAWTYYDDGTSVATYLYKTTFYNSVSHYETGFSPAVLAVGYTPYALKTLEDRVLELFPDMDEKYITRDLIMHAFQDFQDELTAAIMKTRKQYFTATNEATPTALTSGMAYYNLPDGFIYMLRLEIAYDGNNYYRGFPIDITFGQPDDVYNKTRPFYEFIAQQFHLRPTPDNSNGKYKYWAEVLPTQMANPEDELSVFLRPWKRGFIYRALQMAKYKDKKFDEGDSYGKLADRVVSEAVAVLTVRQEDRGLWMELTDPTFLTFDEQFQMF